MKDRKHSWTYRAYLFLGRTLFRPNVMMITLAVPLYPTVSMLFNALEDRGWDSNLVILAVCVFLVLFLIVIAFIGFRLRAWAKRISEE